MEDEHVPEELTEWEQIQSPYPTIIPLSNGNNNGALVIKKDLNSESSVFPPGNHEELPISTTEETSQRLQEQRPTNLLPPSADDDDIRRWKRLNWEVLQTEISRISQWVKKYASYKVGLCSISRAFTGVSAVLLAFFLRVRLQQWWTRRVKQENGRESLMLLIKEKDKKINQLLLQIAQMNEILLARRRVQVIRV